VSAPALTIVLRLEEPVSVTIDASNDSEYARLVDWVDNRYAQLLAAALDVIERERAA
jgi:hypothetical protein